MVLILYLVLQNIPLIYKGFLNALKELTAAIEKNQDKHKTGNGMPLSCGSSQKLITRSQQPSPMHPQRERPRSLSNISTSISCWSSMTSLNLFSPWALKAATQAPFPLSIHSGKPLHEPIIIAHAAELASFVRIMSELLGLVSEYHVYEPTQDTEDRVCWGAWGPYLSAHLHH